MLFYLLSSVPSSPMHVTPRHNRHTTVRFRFPPKRNSSAPTPARHYSNRWISTTPPRQIGSTHGKQLREHRRNHRGGPSMCGVIGILLADRDAQVSPELYDGLTILQHRGQDTAGIATSDGRKLHLRKDKGLVRVCSSYDINSKHHRAVILVVRDLHYTWSRCGGCTRCGVC